MGDSQTRRGFGSTLLAFNTVERLLKGDFFHTVTLAEVAEELASLPSAWSLVGLGTTNWQERHGELFVEGTAGAPAFSWADPDGDPPAAVVALDDHLGPRLPFVAVAACDPDGTVHRWRLDDGEDLHAAIAARCQAANIGLAAIIVTGELRDVRYQVMCHLPIGGITAEHEAVARQERRDDDEWRALGLYAANPTIQSIVSHGVAAVHLHGQVGSPPQGGHVNSAVATAATDVEVRPLPHLVMRIHALDVAVHSVPDE
jgi:predicted DNA-binding protein with PD1-like motif